MRNKQTIITLTAVSVAIAAYMCLTPTPQQVKSQYSKLRIAPVTNDGEAEASEVIEPLMVLNSMPPIVTAPAEMEELARVNIEPGAKQAPRPDQEPGKILRMPYADEEEGLDLTRSISQIIERELPRLHLFDELDK